MSKMRRHSRGDVPPKLAHEYVWCEKNGCRIFTDWCAQRCTNKRCAFRKEIIRKEKKKALDKKLDEIRSEKPEISRSILLRPEDRIDS